MPRKKRKKGAENRNKRRAGELFGTTDAGLIVRGRAVIYQSVTQPPTVAIQ